MVGPNPHNLKHKLINFSITQQRVADILGVSQPLINYYLNGRRQAPPHIAEKLDKISVFLDRSQKTNLLEHLKL